VGCGGALFFSIHLQEHHHDLSSKNVLAIVIPFKCLHTTNTRIKKYKTRWGGGGGLKQLTTKSSICENATTPP